MSTILIIGGLIIITICLISKYIGWNNIINKFKASNKISTDNIKENEKQILSDNEPLTNAQFYDTMLYLDEKEDSRTDYKTSQHSWTNLWLFIIATYFLIQIVKEIIIFIIQCMAGMKLIDILQSLSNFK